MFSLRLTFFEHVSYCWSAFGLKHLCFLHTEEFYKLQGILSVRIVIETNM